MLNVVESDGMGQQHVVVDQHVHMEMLIITNVYHQEDHPAHHFLLVVARAVQLQYHLEVIFKQV